MSKSAVVWQFVLWRLAAYLLDVVIVALLVQVTQWLFWWWTGGQLQGRLQTGWQFEAWILSTVSLPVWLYFSLFEASRLRATPAKRWLGLQIVDTHQNRLSFGKALLRTILTLLPWEITHVTLFLPTPIWYDAQVEFRIGFAIAYGLLILYILPIFYTEQRQSLPDFICGSQVQWRRYQI